MNPNSRLSRGQYPLSPSQHSESTTRPPFALARAHYGPAASSTSRPRRRQQRCDAARYFATSFAHARPRASASSTSARVLR